MAGYLQRTEQDRYLRAYFILSKRKQTRKSMPLFYFFTSQRPARYYLGGHLLWWCQLLQPRSGYLSPLYRKYRQRKRIKLSFCRKHGGRQAWRRMDLYRRRWSELSGTGNRTFHSLPNGRKISPRTFLQPEMHYLRCRKRPTLHRYSQTGRLVLRHSKQESCLPLQSIWKYLDKGNVQR